MLSTRLSTSKITNAIDMQTRRLRYLFNKVVPPQLDPRSERRNQVYNITSHLLELLERQNVPKDCKSVISLGCGHLAEEAMALKIYLHHGFSYMGIDHNGEKIITAKTMHSRDNDDMSSIRFMAHDVNTLFSSPSSYRIEENGYDLIIMRHPYLIKESNPCYKSFKHIIQHIIPRLNQQTHSFLFATFYTPIEKNNFIKHFNEQQQICLHNQLEIDEPTNPTLEFHDDSIKLDVCSDQYSIGGKILDLYTAMLTEDLGVAALSGEKINNDTASELLSTLCKSAIIDVFGMGGASEIIFDYCFSKELEKDVLEKEVARKLRI